MENFHEQQGALDKELERFIELLDQLLPKYQFLLKKDQLDQAELVRLGEIEIYFRPITYQQLWDNTQIQFNEEDIIDMLQDDSVDEQIKSDKIDELLAKVRSLSTQVLLQNIHYVQTPTERVDDPEYIAEWLSNCDRSVYVQLQDSVNKYTADTQIKSVDVTCSACATLYQHGYTLDMSDNE
jgi:hypothetical protein